MDHSLSGGGKDGRLNNRIGQHAPHKVQSCPTAAKDVAGEGFTRQIGSDYQSRGGSKYVEDGVRGWIGLGDHPITASVDFQNPD